MKRCSAYGLSFIEANPTGIYFFLYLVGFYPNLPLSLVPYSDVFHEYGANPLPIYFQQSNVVGRFKIFELLDMLSLIRPIIS
jgi:hypothetical protein